MMPEENDIDIGLNLLANSVRKTKAASMNIKKNLQ